VTSNELVTFYFTKEVFVNILGDQAEFRSFFSKLIVKQEQVQKDNSFIQQTI